MTTERVGFIAVVEGFNEYISQVRSMAQENDNVYRSQQKVQAQSAETEKQTTSLGQSFKGLAGALATVAAGYISLGVLKSVIDDTAQLGEQTLKLQRQTGLTAESASALLFVVKEMGGDVSAAGASFGIFTRNLVNTRDALQQGKDVSTPFVNSLDALGVKIFTASGQLRPFDQILLDLADKFKTLGPSEEAAGRASDLFGRGYQSILPVLQLGRQGMQEAEAEAHKLGLVLSGENVNAIHQYVLESRKMDEAIGSLKLQLGLALIPALTQLSRWFTEHIDDIKKFATAGIQDFKQFAGDVKEGVGVVKDALGWIPDNQMLIEAAIVAIGATMVKSWGSKSEAALGLLGILSTLEKLKGDQGSLGNLLGSSGQLIAGLGLLASGNPLGVPLALSGAGGLKNYVDASNGGDNGRELTALREEREQLLRDIDQAMTRLGQQPEGFESGTQPGGGSLRDQLLAKRGQVDTSAEQQRLEDLRSRFSEVDDQIAQLGGTFGKTADKADKTGDEVQKTGDDLGQIPPKVQQISEEMRAAIDDVKKGLISLHDAAVLGITPNQAGMLEAVVQVKKAQEDAADGGFKYIESLARIAEAYRLDEDAARRLVEADAERTQKAIEDAASSLFSKPTREVAQLTLQMDKLQLVADETSQRLQPVIDGLKDMKEGLEREKDALNDQKDALSAASDAIDTQIKSVQSRAPIIGAVGPGGPTQQQTDLAKAGQDAAVAELQKQKDAIDTQAKAIDRQEKAIDKQEKSIDQQVAATQKQVDAANKQVQAIQNQLKLEDDHKKILQDEFTIADHGLKTDAERDKQAQGLIDMESTTTALLANIKASLGQDFDQKIQDAKDEFHTLQGEVAVLNRPDHMQSMIDKTFDAAAKLTALTTAVDAATTHINNLSLAEPPQPSQSGLAQQLGNALHHAPGATGFAVGGFVQRPTFAMLAERAQPELVLPLSDAGRSRELLSMVPASTLAAMMPQGGGIAFSPTFNISGETLESMRQMAHSEIDRAMSRARTSSKLSGALITGGIG